MSLERWAGNIGHLSQRRPGGRMSLERWAGNIGHVSRPTPGSPGDVAKPLCPWCLTFIEPDDATGTVLEVTWHAGCVADYHRTDSEVDQGGLG